MLIFVGVIHSLGNAVYAAGGSAILRSQYRFYAISEVLSAVMLGTGVMIPIHLYMDRAYHLQENHSTSDKCISWILRLGYHVAVSFIGYQLLQLSAEVKMKFEQHLASYAVGIATLSFPVDLLQGLILVMCYRDYFDQNDEDASSSEDLEEQNTTHALTVASVNTVPTASAHIMLPEESNTLGQNQQVDLVVLESRMKRQV